MARAKIIFTNHFKNPLSNTDLEEKAEHIEQKIRRGGSDEGDKGFLSTESTSSGDNKSGEDFDNIIDKANSPNLQSPVPAPSKLERLELEIELGSHNNQASTAVKQIVRILSCVTQIRDLSDFTYYCIRYGGVSFIFSYLIFTLLIAVPFAFMEATIGQYTTLPAVTLFSRIAPALSGIGVLMLIYRVLYTIYILLEPKYFIYMIKFFGIILGGNDNFLSCESYKGWVCYEPSIYCDGQNVSIGGRCIDPLKEDRSYSRYSERTITTYFAYGTPTVGYSPAQIFFTDLNHAGTVSLLSGCFAIIFVSALVTNQGMKFFSKMCYFLCFAPLLGFIALAAYTCSAEGWDAVGEVLVPRWGTLADKRTWYMITLAAARTMSLCDGTFITLGAMSAFRNNIARDIFLTVGFGVLIRILSLLAIVPMYVHAIAAAYPSGAKYSISSQAVNEIVTSSKSFWNNLMFVVLPEIERGNSVHTYITAIFYATMFLSMIGYQVITMEMIRAAIYHTIPRLLYFSSKLIRLCILTAICSGFLLLLMLSYHGVVSPDLQIGYGKLIREDLWIVMAIFEVFVFVYIYRSTRLLVNLQTMIGKNIPAWLHSYCNYVLRFFWAIVLPVSTVILLFLAVISVTFTKISIESVTFAFVANIPFYIMCRKMIKAWLDDQPMHTLFQTHRKWGPVNMVSRRRAEHDERAARLVV